VRTHPGLRPVRRLRHAKHQQRFGKPQLRWAAQ
jgi:hypothetical protein